MIADGHGPTFTFSPGNAGTYTVTYTASDQNGGQGTATVVITSLAVAPVITARRRPRPPWPDWTIPSAWDAHRPRCWSLDGYDQVG